MIIKPIQALLLTAVITSCSTSEQPASDKKATMNHLQNEQSPYLLQHADNPVDWYPWGAEAFDQAQRLNRPIFLSIGYSTCHWCHVMEHESFEDETVAKLLNENFVAIKVDREELPEIDHLYMTVCQTMTGSGGWPLTIIMTPDKEPFFAGTYFPRSARFGRTGMLELLPAISDAWNNRQVDIQKSVAQIKNHLTQIIPQKLGTDLTPEIHDQTMEFFRNRFDEKLGGFGSAPKFPSPHNLLYLMRYYHFSNDSAALAMVEKTLQAIRYGGIYDHLGFGVHRYSTDSKWLVPHFEKMLYDQAMLTLAYLEIYQITGNQFYAETAREILAYVTRDMTDQNGGFYSAEDADSEGEEGKFYVWTRSEIIDILGAESGSKFCQLLNIKIDGNFRDEGGESESPVNIPHLTLGANIGKDDLHLIANARSKLMAVRNQRIRPFKDDKILTDWNGLMIAAFAKAAVILDDPQYVKIAANAAGFIKANLTKSNGRLNKRYRSGKAGIAGHLDDYAFFSWGLLELYEATFDPQYLEQALQLTQIMISDFHDSASGGFFLGRKHSATELIAQSKTAYDGAIPSGNSVAALVLTKLGRITGQTDFMDLAENTFKVFSNSIQNGPGGFTHLLSAHLFELDDPREIVVVQPVNLTAIPEFIKQLNQLYLPGKIILVKSPDSERLLSTIAPWTAAQNVLNNQVTIYICKNYACNQPLNDSNIALKLINEK